MILSPKTNYLLVFPLIYSIHYFRMYFSKGDVKLNAFNIKLFNPKISRIMDFLYYTKTDFMVFADSQQRPKFIRYFCIHFKAQ